MNTRQKSLRRVALQLTALVALTLLPVAVIPTSSPAIAAGATLSGSVTVEGTGAPAVIGTGMLAYGPSVYLFRDDGTFAAMAISFDGFYSIDISGLPAGQYTLAFHESWAAPYKLEYWNNKASFAEATFFALNPAVSMPRMNAQLAVGPTVPTARLSGSDRYATSAKISEQFPIGTQVAFVANGLNYPDALSAAAAAGSIGAPLLLTSPSTLPAVVENEIKRLNPQLVVVVGGPSVVSEAVKAKLETLVPAVVRLSGANRYETSEEIARGVFEEFGAPHVFIATGRNFPDALSASAAAGALGAPVILVDGAATTITHELETLLEDLGTTDVSIAGGPSVVSAGIESALRKVPSIELVERLSGTDRYLTALEINSSIFAASPVMYLAVGTGYADALAGAALAGYQQAPLFLARGNCVPYEVLAKANNLGVEEIILLGGPSVLSWKVANLYYCPL